MGKRGKILFAVLNWGLGHATRSIPLIQELLNHNYDVVLASDGASLDLLRKEFPLLDYEELPGYNISYSHNRYFFTSKLLSQIPHILQTMRKEQKISSAIVDKHAVQMIISDNRFGVMDKRIKNIYITHQLRVLSGYFTPLTTWLHSRIYTRYDQIWVPDFEGNQNLSGKLGHLDSFDSKIKYLGIVSRFGLKKSLPKYEILAVLSGPEPQRSLLEEKLVSELSKLEFRTAIVQGIVSGKSKKWQQAGIDFYNYLNQKELEKLINASEIIISRSGYTSVMDLVKIKKMCYGFLHQDKKNKNI